MAWFLFCFVGIIHFQSAYSVGDTYKAGIVDPSFFKSTTPGSDPVEKHLKIIEDASKQNVDILVFPFVSLHRDTDADGHQSPDFGLPISSSDDVPCASNQYPKEISHISCAARDARVYVVVKVPENKYCDDSLETLNTNIVFDRNGEIISRYSENIYGNTNCSVVETNRTFQTDFGVTFGILSDSDIIGDKNYRKSNVKNYILFSDSAIYAKITMTNFLSAWAYVHKVNLLLSHISDKVPIYTGVYSTREIKILEPGSRLLIMDVEKTLSPGNPITSLSSQQTHGSSLEYSEDLNSYSVQLLGSTLTNKGHETVVCQEGFCCDFFLKTSGQRHDSLALAVFNGVEIIGTRTIGLQICKVIYCDDIVQDKCTVRFSKDRGLVFQTIRVSGNFSKLTARQYPAVMLKASSSDENQFIYDSINRDDRLYTSLKMTGAGDVAEFGILSREFSRDVGGMGKTKLNMSQNREEMLSKSYLDKNQILNFFDSLWTTFRIPVFIISIYVLEQI